MPRAEDENVIQTFTLQHSDQPFGICVLPHAFDEGKQSPRAAEQIDGAIAVLNVGGVNNNVQQEAHRVDQDVPLATLDLLARVEACRIEHSPLCGHPSPSASR